MQHFCLYPWPDLTLSWRRSHHVKISPSKSLDWFLYNRVLQVRSWVLGRRWKVSGPGSHVKVPGPGSHLWVSGHGSQVEGPGSRVPRIGPGSRVLGPTFPACRCRPQAFFHRTPLLADSESNRYSLFNWKSSQNRVSCFSRLFLTKVKVSINVSGVIRKSALNYCLMARSFLLFHMCWNHSFSQ